jgi:hypothetical protein
VDSAPDHQFKELADLGQEFWSTPAPYGQKNCQGQAIVEIPEDSLKTAAGLLISSTWDQTQVNVPCTSRHSEFTVWVQHDEGKNGPGQEPSPFFNWENYDEVKVAGVETNGFCLAVKQARRRDPLPDSLIDFASEPVSFVALGRDLPSGRVTNVKIVGHATSACAELPLEFQAVTLSDPP